MELVIINGECLKCGERTPEFLVAFMDVSQSPPGFHIVCKNAQTCAIKQAAREQARV